MENSELLDCINKIKNSSIKKGAKILESLGYKSTDIKHILPKINKELKLEEQIKEALKLMLK